MTRWELMQAEIATNHTKAEQLRERRLRALASDTFTYQLSDTRTVSVRLVPPDKSQLNPR